MRKLDQPSNLNWTILFICWLIACVSTLGSLFFSDVMDFPPCALCWYQRIFMFPLVLLFLAGLFPFDIRYAPFHDGADYFVKILEAAKKQGKFWTTLDIIYRTQRHCASHHNPQPQLIWKFLPRAGLDLDRIRKDMNDPEIEKIIQQDLADAEALNVRKTPGFFVNGKPLESFGHQQLRDLVESEVRKYY